jgi:SAM-dependent methyltransferase
MQECHCLGTVREQYENYPYPRRDPEDERKRLVRTILDPLCKINHYCFRGKQNFGNSFRVLIAGGGTGDAAIYLSEQLRETDAQVIYVDISAASMEIAKQRARIRELNNIEWIQDSLLDLPRMGLGEFDYINCSGVLHHLENPVEGLKALRNALSEEGAMGIMVYGEYGRTGVYQMQELMRLINSDEPNMHIQLENAKAILDCLPATNWFKKAEQLFLNMNSENSDIDIFDCLLHSQDKAYTVLELHDWLNECGLNLAAFAEAKAFYRPETFVKDADLLERIKELPIEKQQAIAEIITGALKKHVFYASPKEDTVATPYDKDNIPFFYKQITAETLYDIAKGKPAGTFVEMKHPQQGTIHLVLGEYTQYLLKYLNGRTSLREVFELIRTETEFGQKKPSDEEIFCDFKKAYELFDPMDVMLLRHESVPAFKPYR